MIPPLPVFWTPPGTRRLKGCWRSLRSRLVWLRVMITASPLARSQLRKAVSSTPSAAMIERSGDAMVASEVYGGRGRATTSTGSSSQSLPSKLRSTSGVHQDTDFTIPGVSAGPAESAPMSPTTWRRRSSMPGPVVALGVWLATMWPELIGSGLRKRPPDREPLDGAGDALVMAICSALRVGAPVMRMIWSVLSVPNSGVVIPK